MSPELTHAQTPIWVGQRLHPDSPLYNMAFTFLFPGEVEAERFGEAWRRVADRSDVLVAVRPETRRHMVRLRQPLSAGR